MEKELTEVYCGNGKGKTALAIGQSLRVATQGKSVIVIQFLKGRDQRSLDFLQDVDNLDFKIFRFEKRECCYEDLTEEEKAEEAENGEHNVAAGARGPQLVGVLNRLHGKLRL